MADVTEMAQKLSEAALRGDYGPLSGDAEINSQKFGLSIDPGKSKLAITIAGGALLVLIAGVAVYAIIEKNKKTQ